MSQLCEWDQCDQPASCTVHAQWTYVDFVNYEACDDHSDEMMRILERRMVDGQACMDAWITWYERVGDDLT